MKSGQLTGGCRHDEQKGSTGEHLHGGRYQRPARCRESAGQDRAQSPGEARAKDDQDSTPGTAGRPGQETDSGEATEQAGYRGQPDPHPVHGEVQHRQPEGHRGHQQGCQAGRDGAFTGGHTAVPAAEHEAADDRGG